MSRCAVTGPGVCAGMGTANSMHLAAEALGMALPGTTPVLALGPAMWDAVAAAGARIVRLVEEDVTPRSILTPAAFANAVTAILAVSGSVNCLKHLQAIAVEAGTDVDVYRLFETLAPKVPLLTDVKPNGEHADHRVRGRRRDARAAEAARAAARPVGAHRGRGHARRGRSPAAPGGPTA